MTDVGAIRPDLSIIHTFFVMGFCAMFYLSLSFVCAEQKSYNAFLFD